MLKIEQDDIAKTVCNMHLLDFRSLDGMTKIIFSFLDIEPFYGHL